MNRPGLTIDTKPLHGSAVLVRLVGVVDANTYTALEEALKRQLSLQRFLLVVDMTDVTYLASAGIGVLIATLSRVRENHGNLVLLNPQAEVESVLNLLGLRECFDVACDRTAALHLLEQKVA